MLDAEVAQLTVGVPDGPDHEHRLGQVVEQGVDRLLRDARRPGRRGPGGPRSPGRSPPASEDRCWRTLAVKAIEPGQLTSITPSSSPLRSRNASTARAPSGSPAAGAGSESAALAPPQVGGTVSDPLGRAVQLRRDVPPVARLAAGQALLAEQHEGPVALEEPDHHRGRAERVHDLRGQGAGQLGAVRGQLGGRLGEQRRGPGREARAGSRAGYRARRR